MKRNQVPRCTYIRTTSSWSCTRRSRERTGTCTTSNSTSSSGAGYLVTVHGPVNPAVDPSTAMVEVNAVLGRLESGRLLPRYGFELSLRAALRADGADARTTPPS